MTRSRLGVAAALALGLSAPAGAADVVTAEQFDGTRIGFLLQRSNHNATLTITGPNGLNASTFSKSGAVAIDLREFGIIDDGEYSYQLTAATSQTVRSRNQFDDGRDRNATQSPVMEATVSGTFRVVNGAIVKPKSAAQTARFDRDAK